MRGLSSGPAMLSANSFCAFFFLAAEPDDDEEEEEAALPSAGGGGEVLPGGGSGTAASVVLAAELPAALGAMEKMREGRLAVIWALRRRPSCHVNQPARREGGRERQTGKSQTRPTGKPPPLSHMPSYACSD